MASETHVHWLVDVARRAHLNDATRLEVATNTPLSDAWGVVSRVCRIDEPELAAVVAKRFGLLVANVENVERRALKLVPESVAREFGVLPLRETDRNIFVATSFPLDYDAEQSLGFAAGRTPVFEVAPPAAVAEAIETLYSPDRVVEALLGSVGGDLTDSVRLVDEPVPDALGLQEVTTAPVVRLTNFILQEAVRERASDIHVEPARNGGIVRIRVDGVLRTQMQLPAAAYVRVVSRIKILGRLNIADRMRPQDGRARLQIGSKAYDLRISTIPVREREKVVIRILDPESSPSLGALGMAPHELARIQQLIGFREGVVIVTGPTGSGKTTTMYGALRQLATGSINIMTVEDPVEYELPGVTQIQVETKRGVTFASSLRAILRQDPDIVFVGEIRDGETAEIAMQASMTGHLVFATLHTNDAIGSIPRLLDLGVTPASIAACVRGVIAQRLVRRVCETCKQAIDGDMTPRETELGRRYGMTPTIRATGCKRCSNTGYRGRLAIAEVLVATPAVVDGIARSAPPSILQQLATAGGMRPLREVALDAVRSGITTIDEVERVVGELSAAPPAVAGTTTSDSGSVLIVDDDPVIRRLARALLERLPLQVSEADDGPIALAMAEASGEYSLMILDLDMPTMNGRDVIARLRANPATASLPVIVLTGAESRDDEAAIMDAGADDYIKKPIDPARFLSRVKAMLRRSGE